MRTTIEISDKHRSILLSLAAEKGLRGYSRIVAEALDYYIENRYANANAKRKMLDMKNTWALGEAEETKQQLNDLRKNWNR